MFLTIYQPNAGKQKEIAVITIPLCARFSLLLSSIIVSVHFICDKWAMF